jgi:hypothetical protein
VERSRGVTGADGARDGRVCAMVADEQLPVGGTPGVAGVAELLASGSSEEAANRARKGIGGDVGTSASAHMEDQVRGSMADPLAIHGGLAPAQLAANGHRSVAVPRGMCLEGHGSCITVPDLSSKGVAEAACISEFWRVTADLSAHGSLDEVVAADPLEACIWLNDARKMLVLDSAARAGLDVHKEIRPKEMEVQDAARLVRQLQARGVGQEDWW